MTDGPAERVSVRMPPTYIDVVDEAVERGEYFNRSEAIRTAIRECFVDGVE